MKSDVGAGLIIFHSTQHSKEKLNLYLMYCDGNVVDGIGILQYVRGSVVAW